MPRRTRHPARGVSLIELMVSMAILVGGMIAMWHLHMYGIVSTAAGRRHTEAVAAARALVSGLERLPFGDPRLANHVVGAALPPGALWGRLAEPGGGIRAGAHEWTDENPVPGVPLVNDPLIPDAWRFERRWTVWGLLSPDAGAAGMTPGVKLVAVSVIWRDPPFNRPREVVLYTQVANPATLVTGLGAIR